MSSGNLSVNSGLRPLDASSSRGSDWARSMARYRLKHTGEEKEVENHVTRERDHVRSGSGLRVDWGFGSGWLRHLVLLRNVMVRGGIFREKGWLADRSRRTRTFLRLVKNPRWCGALRRSRSLERCRTTIYGRDNPQLRRRKDGLNGFYDRSRRTPAGRSIFQHLAIDKSRWVGIIF